MEREGLGDEGLRAGLERAWVKSGEEYVELLAPLAREVDVWETRYFHVLRGEDAVLEWVRGSGLRPVLEGLEEGERQRFLARYAEELRRAYPLRGDGRVVYGVPRLFVVART